MPSCLWTFETLTTTGLEPDIDTLSSIALTPAVIPIPSCDGHTGNGRLLCSGNFYNEFSTTKNVALLHTSGNPVSLGFWWRPLVDYPTFLAGNVMLTYAFEGYVSGGAVGNTGIRVNVLSNATAGLYDFQITVQGFYATLHTETFTGIALDLRDWNEIGFSYDGADTLDFAVNGVSIGTIGPTDLPMPTTEMCQLLFAKEFAATGALFGVLDTVSLTVS